MLPVQPARAQIEKGGLVKLTDRCTVAALDVIRVDFQFWLGIYLRFLRKQQVVIGLVSVSAVRAFVHEPLRMPRYSCLDVAGPAR